MDYKLAKKLKDAGFPQNSAFQIVLCKTEGEPFELIRLRNANMDGYEVIDTVDAPFLSELIGACGKRIKRIEKKRTLWYAIEEDECCDDPQDQYGYCITSGSTPEIAVANLWLVLNPTST